MSIIQKIRGLDGDFALLHSSKSVSYSDGQSVLAYGKIDHVKTDDRDDLQGFLEKYKDHHIFGYIAYEHKNSLEDLPRDEDFFINYENLNFAVFDKVEYLSDAQKAELDGFDVGDLKLEISELESNFTDEEYLYYVRKIKDYIKAGDIYQANLTRKYYSRLESETELDKFDLYLKLNQISPAPFSAFYRFDGLEVISSSPELFLNIDDDRNIFTCPIKGSAKPEDVEKLKSSLKDKAENLMITDLMRNDFSRVCEAGSVKVDKLFAIEEFATICHMYSTIEGKLRGDISAFEAIESCFPPGSMTGAPKIRAMEICSEIEKIKRGIYSGTLGYFTPNGGCNFSVVIRTIISREDRLEFQVGGAIVADSTPEKELEETRVKADGMLQALGV